MSGKGRWAVGPSLLALWAGVAQAQTAEESQPTDVAEIVVTGQRAAEERAIETKRETFVISDGVSADDIGSLPDHNTAAALRRIPGVSVQEDQGEPRFPVVRGLSSTYNRTTIDGAIVASVGNGDRTVPLDIVPSSLAGGIQIFKAVTPDQDANAIGGAVDIRTRSAFDEAARAFFSGTAAGAKYEQAGDQRDEEASYRASFSAGTRFGSDEQFGVVVAASYQKRDSDIPQVEVASPSYREYTAAGAPVDQGAATGNDRLVPIQVRQFWYNNIRERTGLYGKLEWRPRETLRMALSGNYARMEDDEERIESRYEPVGNVSGQTATTGSFASGLNNIGIGRFQINRSIWGGNFGVEWDVSDTVLWTARAIYSGAELDNPESTEDFRGQGTNFAFGYNADFLPIFTPTNAAATLNPANYPFFSRNELLRSSKEDVYEARSDLRITTALIGDETEFKVGGVLRRTERDFDQNSITFALAAGHPAYTLADVFQEGPTPLIYGRYRTALRIDSDAALTYFVNNRARFTPSPANNLLSDYQVEEDIYAAYAQARVTAGRFELLGGLRFERTEVDSQAFRSVPAIGTTPAQTVPNNRSDAYDHLLPSVHARFDVTDEIVIRAAYTNTIGRPDFGSITAREQVTLGTGLPTLSLGNPGLKPRESEAYDVSLEWYVPDGLIALAVFRKDIENEIFTLTNVETRDVGRGLEQVNVSQPLNAEAAKIVGFEAAWQQALTFLPAPFDGLGFNANATLIDAELNFRFGAIRRRLRLFQQPEITTNSSIYYQRGPFEGRVSANYIGGFLETVNATIPGADQYWKGRHTYDAQVSWRFNDHFTVFGEVENLNDAGRLEVTGPNRDLLQEAAEYGRVYWLGLTASF